MAPKKLSSSRVPVEWMGSALETLKTFPPEVQDVLGYAIDLAQVGGKHPAAKPLTGDKVFKGAGVLEAVDRFDGNTYRAVYTVRFAGVVYVLDAFQKKSKVGIKTPLADIKRVKARLKAAELHYAENYRTKAG
jgi:phage-related protein